MRTGRGRVIRVLVWMLVACAPGLLPPAQAQQEQRVDVVIKGFRFIASAAPLLPGIPTVIVVHNEDDVRHDFGSNMFYNAATEVESDGVVTYGRAVGGVLLDPDRRASVRLTIERAGRFEFRCSIHPDMVGELLLLNIGAV
ncbi:cupredoxin domain-containing protein [Candidatus Nitrospira bockiana]